MDHILVDLFSGWVYLINNRVLICWTSGKTTYDTYFTNTFPTSFSTTNYKVTICVNAGGDTDWYPCYSDKTKSNVRIYVNNGTVDVISVGY